MISQDRSGREPIFNIPGPILAVIVVLGGIHALREVVLSPRWDAEVILLFSFIPARYLVDPSVVPGGVGAQIWTFASYALLHGGIAHLAVNCLWLVVFGSPLIIRFGVGRFFLFSLACAIGGSVAHLATHWGEPIPVIGASAAISGHMAAAARFVFSDTGSIVGLAGDPARFRQPALPITRAFRNRTVVAFVAIWFIVNFAFGSGAPSLTGGDNPIAWEAHIGGFVLGLLLFPLFDPVSRRP